MKFNRKTEVEELEKTPVSRSGGFLFDLKLPLLAVLIASTIMVCSLSQLTTVTTAPLTTQDGHLASLFSPEIQYWEQKIINWSEKWDLDPNLVATVMQIESCGDPRAISSVGAMGLFQVMPYHFSDSEDPYKPNINAKRGLAYLKSSLESSGGNVKRALAGYNGGLSTAAKPESLWPAETVRFVYWGTGIYSDAKNGKNHSERLQEWLAAGGHSLCAAASDRLGLPGK
jgi:soluble lytic murein transglycosylase-like protein